MRRFGLVVLVLLAARTAWLTVDYLLDGETRRYHVEASATLFVLCGFALRLVISRANCPNTREAPNRQIGTSGIPSRFLAVLFVAAAFALYWPALQVGWLSDDFVLLARASDWDVGAVTPALFRPVPLAVWSVLGAAGAPAAAWHALNVLLHGVNAWLTVRLASGWMCQPWPVVAGALMLSLPLAPEAVVWASGIFDVSATTLTLGAVLAARAFASGPQRGARVALYGAVLLAIGCKETGVVAPVLVLLDAWIRRALNRRLLVDLAALTAVAAAFSLVRLTGAFGVTTPPVSKYLIQRVIFESYGSLSVPWHAHVLATAPWIAALVAVLLIGLFAWVFAAARSRLPRVVPGAAAWILVAVLPVAPILFVAPDLQGSRYLYLAGPAWAGLVAAVAAGTPTRIAPATAAILAALVLVWTWGVRQHLVPWQTAGAARDAVLTAATEDDRVARCGTVAVSELPDNVAGAYVFRNGAPEAFGRLGINLQDAAPPECTFIWDASAQLFVAR